MTRTGSVRAARGSLGRRLYCLAAYGLAPAYCAALLSRGVRERAYWQHLGERLGLGPALRSGGIWIHAASAGEVQAAAPLIAALRRREPQGRFVVTASTPAGAERARALASGSSAAGTGVDVRLVPLDLPGSVRRFFARTAPRLALVLETELWPHLYYECARRGVPLALVSARLSERSARRYARVRGIVGRALEDCTLIAAQTQADADRFVGLGAPPGKVHVAGNLKLDFEVPQETLVRGRELRARHAPGRPLWVAGSTHAGEESVLLDAHRAACEVAPGALLVMAPRHRPRFGEVGSWLESRGVRVARRSLDATCDSRTEVLLLDSLGELLDFYAAADVVFVGGSLVPIGGHNLVEPAALGRPILAGPHLSSAAQIARLLEERGALEIVRDAHALGRALGALLSSPDARARVGARARAAVEESRGAVVRVVRLIEPYLTAGARARETSTGSAAR